MSSCSLKSLNNRNLIKQIRNKYFMVMVFLGAWLFVINLWSINQNLWQNMSGVDAAEAGKWNLLVNAVSFFSEHKI